MAGSYSAGTVAVTNGGTTVTLTGGTWLASNVKAGDTIEIAGETPHIVKSLTDGNNLELWVAVSRTTASGLSYVVLQNSADWGTNFSIAQDVSALIQSVKAPVTMDNVTSVPDNADGANGDYRLLTTTNDLYYKSNDVWSIVGNLGGGAGAAGNPNGVEWAWDTGTTDADPGAGNIRGNNATLSSVTALYIDNVEAGGADVSTWIDTWDDSTSTNKGFLLLRSKNAPTAFRLFHVSGAVTDKTGYREVVVTHIAGQGSLSASDPMFVTFAPAGNKGDTGAAGVTMGMVFAFSTATTDANPGAGVIRFDNAAPGSVGWLYISDTDSAANNIEAWVQTLDDSTSTIRARMTFKAANDEGQFMTFAVTGVVVDGTDYWKVPVTLESPASPTLFADAENIVVTSAISADKGDAGAGLTGIQAEKAASWTVGASDSGTAFIHTGGSASTCDFVACASLGSTFLTLIKNEGAGTVTLDPNGTELIDGVSTVDVLQGQTVFVFCNGTALRTVFTNDFASQAEAEAGTAANRPMNALRTKQAIAALGTGFGELLSTTVVSSTSVVDLTLSGTGLDIIVYEELRPVADDVDLWFLLSTDGGTTFPNTAGDYKYVAYGLGDDGTIINHKNVSATAIKPHGTAGQGNGSQQTAYGVLEIMSDTTTRQTVVFYRHTYKTVAGDIRMVSGRGTRISSETTNVLRIKYSSGDMNSGTIRHYKGR